MSFKLSKWSLPYLYFGMLVAHDVGCRVRVGVDVDVFEVESEVEE